MEPPSSLALEAYPCRYSCSYSCQDEVLTVVAVVAAVAVGVAVAGVVAVSSSFPTVAVAAGTPDIEDYSSAAFGDSFALASVT